jgi:hypothetical protein
MEQASAVRPVDREADAYVEHELAGENAEDHVPGMRAHLHGCLACAEEHDSLRDLIAAT